MKRLLVAFIFLASANLFADWDGWHPDAYSAGGYYGKIVLPKSVDAELYVGRGVHTYQTWVSLDKQVTINQPVSTDVFISIDEDDKMTNIVRQYTIKKKESGELVPDVITRSVEVEIKKETIKVQARDIWVIDAWRAVDERHQVAWGMYVDYSLGADNAGKFFPNYGAGLGLNPTLPPPSKWRKFYGSNYENMQAIKKAIKPMIPFFVDANSSTPPFTNLTMEAIVEKTGCPPDYLDVYFLDFFGEGYPDTLFTPGDNAPWRDLAGLFGPKREYGWKYIRKILSELTVTARAPTKDIVNHYSNYAVEHFHEYDISSAKTNTGVYVFESFSNNVICSGVIWSNIKESGTTLLLPRAYAHARTDTAVSYTFKHGVLDWPDGQSCWPETYDHCPETPGYWQSTWDKHVDAACYEEGVGYDPNATPIREYNEPYWDIFTNTFIDSQWDSQMAYGDDEHDVADFLNYIVRDNNESYELGTSGNFSWQYYNYTLPPYWPQSQPWWWNEFYYGPWYPDPSAIAPCAGEEVTYTVLMRNYELAAVTNYAGNGPMAVAKGRRHNTAIIYASPSTNLFSKRDEFYSSGLPEEWTNTHIALGFANTNMTGDPQLAMYTNSRITEFVVEPGISDGLVKNEWVMMKTTTAKTPLWVNDDFVTEGAPYGGSCVQNSGWAITGAVVRFDWAVANGFKYKKVN